nr:MAG: major capsid protein [Microvirus sp.]
MQTVNQSHFALAPSVGISRSTFDRSHGYKTTFNGGSLIPIFVDEALPGDTFNLKGSFFARLNTPITPILDNLHFQTFFFEVPVRQIWDNWKKFNGEQDSPGDSTDYLIPTSTSPAGGYDEESIQDYMGIPPLIEGIEHSALPLRAANHIYNEWFRDQNLQNPLLVSRNDGPDNPADYKLFSRGKRHDYFTSSLPWPQKSDSGSVNIPLGTSAPVTTDQAISNSIGVTSSADGNFHLMDTGAAQVQLSPSLGDAAGSLYADLTDATAATINQLRQSIAVQRLFEKDARGGTRYIEVIQNHFKVRSPDLRLQRPGYLGGGSTPINITPVAQTTDGFTTSNNDSPQGNLAAFGTLSATNHGFVRSFSEHTIIIGFCQIRADLTYQQGLNRMWSRQTRFDHYWPELGQIGEQEVLQKELWASGVPAEDDIVFGYQERYAEYRYKPSMITGKMRSSSPESLDIWHLSQDFPSAPLLNANFITDDPPIDRVVAVPSEPDFKLDSYFSLKCARPMRMFGIPGLDKL